MSIAGNLGGLKVALYFLPSPSALTGYHVGALSWLNWTLEMLVFEEGGKLDYPKINHGSKVRNNCYNKLSMRAKPQIG